MTVQIPKIEGKIEFIATYESAPLRELMGVIFGEGKTVVNSFMGGQPIDSDYHILLDFLSRHWQAKRRCHLEENKQYRHPIAYGVLMQKLNLGPDIGDVDSVFVYQRTKVTGEQRLAGKYSIGIGGHVEAKDVFSHNNENNLLQAIQQTLLIEADQEFVFSKEGHEDVPYPIGYANTISQYFIHSDEGVDEFHFGICPILQVPNSINVVSSKEPDNVAIGFKTKTQIMSEGLYENMESWSQKLIDALL